MIKIKKIDLTFLSSIFAYLFFIFIPISGLVPTKLFPSIGDSMILISAVIGVLDLAWYHKSILPNISNEEMQPLAIVIPELLGFLGFSIVLFTGEMLIAFPYILIGAGHTIYAYLKISKSI